MIKLSDEVVHFFREQNYVFVSTIDKAGQPATACKGMVEINKSGRVYIMDLYMANTYVNLKNNPAIAIAAVNEDKFKGYCLKGKAVIVPKEKIPPPVFKAWEEHITNRLTQRLLRNIKEEKSQGRHPEILLPKPLYMISIEVGQAIDLTPHNLK